MGHLKELWAWAQTRRRALGQSDISSGAYVKLGRLARELLGYLWANRHALANYGARSRAGQTIASSLAESAVNELIAKRMNKSQQMRWNRYTVQPFLTVRAHVVDGTLEEAFWPLHQRSQGVPGAAVST